MTNTLEVITRKQKYSVPVVGILTFDVDKDILCMSNESNDNNFNASDLGNGFLD